VKLIWLTDCHVQNGPAAEGQFCVQPLWSRKPDQLFSRLAETARDADAFLFTGDATHSGQRHEVAQFFALLSSVAAGRPVFIVLGNHDVIDLDTRDLFARTASNYDGFQLQERAYALRDVELILLNNYYLARDGSATPFWPHDVFPVPAMPDEQAESLDAILAADKNRPAILVVHCPTHALPGFQTDPDPFLVLGTHRYRDAVHKILDKHVRVRAVLSGHVHFNSTSRYGNRRIHQTLASFIEYPFQVRVINIEGSSINSRMVALATDQDVETTL
jgi:predicted MPP superfamily phosphohydrolase